MQMFIWGLLCGMIAGVILAICIRRDGEEPAIERIDRVPQIRYETHTIANLTAAVEISKEQIRDTSPRVTMNFIRRELKDKLSEEMWRFAQVEQKKVGGKTEVTATVQVVNTGSYNPLTSTFLV